ncbi:tail fibers protein [Vibrio phage vB_VpP_DE17]|uniref:Tail fibers protein n=1 Tax=Vibrio phage vB_VpP_DE17 TaxID=2794848 RepID=A0A7T1X3C3_9CAUD|nr:tail fibers protein [Vibrio phage vB_VpP_DE17]
MALSVQRATSDGTMTNIVLSIEFFDTRDIFVTLDETPAIEGTDYTWQGRTQINFINAPLANGVEVTLTRRTNRSALRHIFSEGAEFTRANLDDMHKQLLYLSQEMTEGSGISDFYGDLDMHRYRVRNMAQGTENRDAVTFLQLKEVADRVTAIENIKGTNRRGPITISTQSPDTVPVQYEEWVMIGDVDNGAFVNSSNDKDQE